MKVGIICCWYLTASYAEALPRHTEVLLVGVFDTNKRSIESFAQRWPCRHYSSREELLADRDIKSVLNLTNPHSHAEVTRAGSSCRQALMTG